MSTNRKFVVKECVSRPAWAYALGAGRGLEPKAPAAARYSVGLRKRIRQEDLTLTARSRSLRRDFSDCRAICQARPDSIAVTASGPSRCLRHTAGGRTDALGRSNLAGVLLTSWNFHARWVPPKSKAQTRQEEWESA
jgi:hypothetical protein